MVWDAGPGADAARALAAFESLQRRKLREIVGLGRHAKLKERKRLHYEWLVLRIVLGNELTKPS
jgi:hypothetical protein